MANSVNPDALRKQTIWTPIQDEIVGKMWGRGCPASLIAEELERALGIKRTRDSVLGRVRRLMLQSGRVVKGKWK